MFSESIIGYVVKRQLGVKCTQFFSPTKCTKLIIYRYHRRVLVQLYPVEGEQNVSFKTKTLDLHRNVSEICLQYFRIFNIMHLHCKIKKNDYVDLKMHVMETL
jgi:hypothetical protein